MERSLTASDFAVQVTILWCKGCGRYLQPPKHWVRAELESKELLTFCIKRIKGLGKVRALLFRIAGCAAFPLWSTCMRALPSQDGLCCAASIYACVPVLAERCCVQLSTLDL